MSKELGVVLLSGGIDSSTALALAVEEYDEVLALAVKYGQRHQKELVAGAFIAGHFNVKRTVLDLTGIIGEGGLTDEDLEIPDKSYAELGDGVSLTYVPFRNGTLLSVATSQGHSYAQYNGHENFDILYGAHADDAAGNAYADCSLAFVDAMDSAIKIGTYGQGRIRAPFVGLSKSEVVRQGEALGVPWELTWSCYRGEEIHCGTCPTCQDRKAAFLKAGVEDPTKYKA